MEIFYDILAVQSSFLFLKGQYMQFHFDGFGSNTLSLYEPSWLNTSSINELIVLVALPILILPLAGVYS